MSVRGWATFYLIKWKMSVGVLYGPKDLFEFKSFIVFITWVTLAGMMKKLKGLSSLRKCEKFFQTCLIFFWSLLAMVEKYSLKVSATCFGSLTNLLLTSNELGWFLLQLLILMMDLIPFQVFLMWLMFFVKNSWRYFFRHCLVSSLTLFLSSLYSWCSSFLMSTFLVFT